MFIICKNDFPFLVCPVGASNYFALKVVEHLRGKLGTQLGLASPIHYHIQEAKIVSQDLIEQLKLENENGINETNHTETTEVKISGDNQTSESTEGKIGDDSTGKGFQD